MITTEVGVIVIETRYAIRFGGLMWSTSNTLQASTTHQTHWRASEVGGGRLSCREVKRAEEAERPALQQDRRDSKDDYSRGRDQDSSRDRSRDDRDRERGGADDRRKDYDRDRDRDRDRHRDYQPRRDDRSSSTSRRSPPPTPPLFLLGCQCELLPGHTSLRA